MMEAMCDTLCANLGTVLATLVVGYISYFLYGYAKVTPFDAPFISVPVPKEISPEWKGEFLDELNIKGAGDDKILCFDPATGEKLAEIRAWTPADVKEACQKARKAQADWSKTSFRERRKVLGSLLRYVVQNQETICKVAARDSGKTMVDGIFGEILTTCEKLRWTILYGEAALETEYRPVGLIMGHKHARLEYLPLGVVAAIVSWNYPFHNTYGPIISALFAGNAIVIKVSEYVAWSTVAYYQSIIHECLRACGHSPDLVQFVIGYADAGQEIIRNVDKVTFIGSPAVGKMVMKAAAETLTPVLLELGGKDAAVICDDCDFNQVVDITMRGTFQNCGQNCIGLERLVIQDRIYDKYIETITPKVQALSQGPTACGTYDCGAMAMGASIDKIQHMVDDAVSKGARLLVGGKRGASANGKGQYYQPTLLVDVTPDMEIAKEEVFGPVMTVMKFSTDAEALQIVNSCAYGLGSNVFSLNKERAERLARGIAAGMSNINDFACSYLCQSLPFGGVKISGFDRFAGPEGLRGNCILKAVTSDRIPGVRTQIPPILRYPMEPASYKFAEALVSVLYNPSLIGRFFSIFTLISPQSAVKKVTKTADAAQ